MINNLRLFYNMLITLVSTSAAHIPVCNRVVNENIINVVVDSLPEDQKSKIWQNKFKIRNQHQKCFPMIYSMTMFGELQSGRPLADPTLTPPLGLTIYNMTIFGKSPFFGQFSIFFQKVVYDTPQVGTRTCVRYQEY